MSAYPDLVRALQQGATIMRALCVRLDFADETVRLWRGVGPLVTIDPGHGPATVTWSGVGRLGSISDIDRAVVTTAQAPTLTLSGIDADLLTELHAASARVKGRPARIFEQYFDPATMAPVDQPVAVYTGLMDRMTLRSDGPTTRAITISLLTLLYRRRRPAFGYLSDVDQRALHPGDRGAERMPALVQADPQWPNYS